MIGKLVEGCILGIAESGWDVGGEEILRLVTFLSLTRRDHANFSLGYYNVTGRTYSISFKGTLYIALNIISSVFRCYAKLTPNSSTLLIRECISIKDDSVSDPVTFTYTLVVLIASRNIDTLKHS